MEKANSVIYQLYFDLQHGKCQQTNIYIMKNFPSSVEPMVCIGIAYFESSDVGPMNYELGDPKTKIIYMYAN